MNTSITTAEDLDALPGQYAVMDRFGDVGVVLNGKVWYPETSPMTTEIVARKYGPFTVLRPDVLTPASHAPAQGSVVPRAEVDRMLAEQHEMDLAMHRAYRPEVVAEIAVHLSEETDWDAIAQWCGGTIKTGQVPSGEYVSELSIPGVGVAWQGAWIVQRHDLSFAIRTEVEGPSAESVAALTTVRPSQPTPDALADTERRARERKDDATGSVDERVATIRARAEASTEGPLEHSTSTRDPKVYRVRTVEGSWPDLVAETDYSPEGAANAEFFAHAREDVTWLTEQLQTQKDEADWLRQTMHAVQEQMDLARAERDKLAAQAEADGGLAR